MRKKGKYASKRRKISLLQFFLVLPLFLLFFSFSATFVLYQSRAVPELGDEVEMTTLPLNLQHILGATQSEKTIIIPIFMYHYVEYVHNDPGKQKLATPPNVLQKQIDTLKAAGYTFLTAQDVINGITGRTKLPEKSIALTFDDGYMDLYTDVFPILQKENIKATAYIIPNLLDRPNYLFTYQLEQLAESPLIEIGAHTMDHPGLAGMNKDTAVYEIAESRKFLQDLLHVPVNSFAYPYGSFDQQAIQIVKDSWFSNAMSVIPGDVQSVDNKYFLNRLRPGYRTGAALLTYLKQDTFQPW